MGFSELLGELASGRREAGGFAAPLVRRGAEHLVAEGGGRTNAPIVGGLADAPLVGLPARAIAAPLNLLGLVGEGAGSIGKAIAAYAALPAVAAQADLGDPNLELTQFARRLVGTSGGEGPRGELLNYLRDPIAQAEALRRSPDTATSWLAGALELAANPLNYPGGIGEFGRGLEAGAPVAGRAVKALAALGEATNRAPLLPLAAFPRARRALLEVPAFLRDGGDTASEPLRAALASPEMARLRDQPPLPPLGDPGPPNPWPGMPGLPLDPTLGEYNRYARGAGLLPLGKEPRPALLGMPASPSPLVPGRVPDLIGLAKEPAKAAKPTQPVADLAAAERAGLDGRQSRTLVEPQPVADPAAAERLRAIALRLGLDDAPKPSTTATPPAPALPDGAVTAAEERAAKTPPDFAAPPDLAAPAVGAAQELPVLAGSRAEILAGLDGRQTRTLLELAYDHPKAIWNAQKKYPSVVALRNRAIERISQSPERVEELARQDPELAKLVGALPDNVDLPASGDTAAGGGGGGGLGLLPYPGGIAGSVGRAVIPASGSGIAGAAVGAGVGAATNEDDRAGGALQGALVGAGVGFGAGGAGAMAWPELRAALPKVVRDTMLDPGMHEDGIAAGLRELEAARGVAGVRGAGEALRGIDAQWRALAVNTPKQLPLDAFTRAMTMWGVAAKEFGATGDDLRRWQKLLREERAAGVSSLTNPLTERLRALGHTDALADLENVYGVDFASQETRGARFGGAGRAATGALLSLGQTARTGNILAPAIGAVRGYFAPFVDGYIRFLNGIQRDAFRFALAEKALDRDLPPLAEAFLAELQRQGHDTAALQGRGGLFSPNEVAQVAGATAGQDWATLTEGLIRRQGDRIAFLGGDFREGSRTGFEQAISKVVPFARWQLRYAPVLAEIAARYPRATALAVGAQAALAGQAAAGGKRASQAGVTFDDHTPLIGPIARLRNGGGEGSVTLNPIGAIAPYGEALAPDDLPADATAYQRVVALMKKGGFSPHPAVQAAAYVTGQDSRTPGNLSRMAGLEAAPEIVPAAARLLATRAGYPEVAAAIPDLPTVPTGRQLLDAGRDLLRPVTGKGAVQSLDPVMKRYDELVIAETGLPLSDPENREFLAAVGRPGNPLWQRAVLEARGAGAAGNAASLVSPVALTAETDEAAAARVAKKGLPAPGLPSDPPSYRQAAGMAPAALAGQRANAAYVADNPAALTYDVANEGDARATLLRDLVARYQQFGLSAAQAQVQVKYDLASGAEGAGLAMFPGGVAPDVTPPRFDPGPIYALQRYLNAGR